MTDLQTAERIESPFTKVNKGMEIVGNWPKHIRALADGSAVEELRCACFYYKHKKTPKLMSEIMSDEITACVVNVINIIEAMANEMLGINGPIVVE